MCLTAPVEAVRYAGSRQGWLARLSGSCHPRHACTHASIRCGHHNYALLQEFSRGIRRGKITPTMLSDVALRALFRAIDTDGSGTIEVDELVQWVGESAGPSNDKFKPKKQPTISTEAMEVAACNRAPLLASPSLAASVHFCVERPHIPAASGHLSARACQAIKHKLLAASYTKTGADLSKVRVHA